MRRLGAAGVASRHWGGDEAKRSGAYSAHIRVHRTRTSRQPEYLDGCAGRGRGFADEALIGVARGGGGG